MVSNRFQRTQMPKKEVRKWKITSFLSHNSWKDELLRIYLVTLKRLEIQLPTMSSKTSRSTISFRLTLIYDVHDDNRVLHKTITILRYHLKVHNLEQLQLLCRWANDRVSPEMGHAGILSRLSASCHLVEYVTLPFEVSRGRRIIWDRKVWHQNWGHLGCCARNYFTIWLKNVLLLLLSILLHAHSNYVLRKATFAHYIKSNIYRVIIIYYQGWTTNCMSGDHIRISAGRGIISIKPLLVILPST